MDREQSWWNEKLLDLSAAYILQHEQIHFALHELAARDLTAKAQRLTAKGNSRAEAQANLQQQIDSLLVEALEDLVSRNTEFDLDTSGRYEPALQSRWYRKVQAELGP